MADLASNRVFMDRFSRQIGAFGLETMAKVCAARWLPLPLRCAHSHALPGIASVCLQLVKLRVLIVGMRGLGVEVAKNLILAGPAAVTVHDEGIARPWCVPCRRVTGFTVRWLMRWWCPAVWLWQ
jgi:ubiquitin-activating enzyme E1